MRAWAATGAGAVVLAGDQKRPFCAGVGLLNVDNKVCHSFVSPKSRSEWVQQKPVRLFGWGTSFFDFYFRLPDFRLTPTLRGTIRYRSCRVRPDCTPSGGTEATSSAPPRSR